VDHLFEMPAIGCELQRPHDHSRGKSTLTFQVVNVIAGTLTGVAFTTFLFNTSLVPPSGCQCSIDVFAMPIQSIVWSPNMDARTRIRLMTRERFGSRHWTHLSWRLHSRGRRTVSMSVTGSTFWPWLGSAKSTAFDGPEAIQRSRPQPHEARRLYTMLTNV